ncbi:MAG: V-type ATP synthase subunit E [bacterium]
MAIQDIIKKIETDAQAVADRIAAETRKESQKITEREEARGAAEAEKIIARAEEEGKRIASRTLQQAELAGRKKLLAAKQAIVEAAFERLETKLARMDDTAYLGLIRRQILEVKGSGQYTLFSSQSTAKLIDKAFVEKLNQELSKAKAGFKLTGGEEHLEIGRGFTLRQQKLDLNFSFAALLSETRKSCYRDVVSALFGETKAK